MSGHTVTINEPETTVVVEEVTTSVEIVEEVTTVEVVTDEQYTVEIQEIDTIVELSGDQGPQGIQGPAGLTWQGAWSALTAYEVGDAVSIDGTSYICIDANTNEQPPSASWDTLAQGGDETVPYALQYDDAGAGVTYIGEALPGTDTTASGWRIKRTTVSGSDIMIEWADGDSMFNNIWDNRELLSYS